MTQIEELGERPLRRLFANSWGERAQFIGV